MACSSTGEQTPASSSPIGSPSPSDGVGRAGTFAELLAQRRCGGSDQLIPYALLTPAPCGHCGKIDDFRRARLSEHDTGGGVPDGSTPLDRRVTVSSEASLVEQVAFEGNSCSTCVRMIYRKNRWLDDGGDTPLHYAARCRNLRMLFHFICLVGDEYGHAGAALVLRKLNGRNETALHEAIRLGNNGMAGLLMWVDPELALYPAPGQGTSPLYLAVSLGDELIASMLHRESGGNLAYSGPDGQNALHAAVHHAYGMLETLHYWNKDLSKQKDRNGRTPLHFVVSSQFEPYIHRSWFCFPSIRLPLEQHATWGVLNANPSAAFQQDNNGFFPVHIAALMNRLVALRILVKRCPGCIGLRDNQGRTFFHIAVQAKILRIVRYAARESIFAPIMNTRDNDGNTALHLAVDIEHHWISCALLRNQEVLLNLSNNKDQTPLDLARSKKCRDFSYGLNPENLIYNTLLSAGARHGSFWRDHLQQLCIPLRMSKSKDEEDHSENEDEENHRKKEDDEKEASAQLTDSTRTLGLGSVLIASVTFTATFTVPAGIKSSDHTNSGIPRLFGTWYFHAFMMASTLAFICSSLATLGLMFSGMSMVKLKIRRMYFKISVFLTSSSLTCLTVAFSLGVYMVLAPVGLTISSVIFIISPLLLIYRNAEVVREMLLTYRPLSVRRGHEFVCRLYIQRIFLLILRDFWPFIFIAIFSSAA